MIKATASAASVTGTTDRRREERRALAVPLHQDADEQSSAKLHVR
jgi:hypothetical protein